MFRRKQTIADGTEKGEICYTSLCDDKTCIAACELLPFFFHFSVADARIR
jgi:hypothetical protein